MTNPTEPTRSDEGWGHIPRSRYLVAIPVYNEEKHVTDVLHEVRRYAQSVLAIDDGSTDETPVLLARQRVDVIRHGINQGYGRSLQDAFRWAAVDGHDWIITMDCDEQHEPSTLPEFEKAILRNESDVISGSRYLGASDPIGCAPRDRRAINQTITAELNARLHLNLTDAFCGFKAYRVSALERMRFCVSGYDFPMQFWVQAVAHGLRIEELPIRLIYNDPNRAFGGPLDDPDVRISHYRATLHRELARWCDQLPPDACRDLTPEAAKACCG